MIINNILENLKPELHVDIFWMGTKLFNFPIFGAFETSDEFTIS